MRLFTNLSPRRRPGPSRWRALWFVWVPVFAGLTSGCGDGVVARSGTPHPTIVSLNPCTDAILAEIAEPSQLLAISHYSQDPAATSMDLAAASRFRVTGETVEEVLALKPDMVVAATFLPPSTRKAFERLGIRVELVGIASTVAESEAQVTRLAQAAGHPERGAALNARIEDALAKARPAPGAAPVSTLLWEQGGIVAGPGSLISELMDRTGFSSQSAARGLGQGAYLPLEQVLADPPRLVLAAGGERALAHPALRALEGTAYRRIDPSLTFCGGPTIIRAARDLAAIRRGVT